jgi:hypothetical protein
MQVADLLDTMALYPLPEFRYAGETFFNVLVVERSIRGFATQL